jgi:hypothetical protein
MNEQSLSKKHLVYLLLLLIPLSYLISKSFIKEINSDFFNEHGYLNTEKVELLIKDVRKGVFPESLKSSPDLYDYLIDELVDADFDLTNNDEQADHLILSSKLLLELTIAANSYKNFSHIISDNEKKALLYELNDYLLKMSSKANLSTINDQVAANLLIFTAIDSAQSSSLNDRKLQEIYSKNLNHQAGYNHVAAAIIVVMWLDRESSTFSQDVHYVVELKQSVRSAGDLIRLMNHDDDQVVLKTAKLIKKIVPDNAIHALRYSLIHSKDENVKLAVLDAITEYGIEARPYVNQLKSYLRLSKSDQVKQKIQTVLKQVSGL